MNTVWDDETSMESEFATRVLALHIENSPLAVIEWDNQFHIKRWSKRAEEMFGWTAQEVVGKHPLDIGYIHEEDMAGVHEVVSQLIEGHRTRSINRNRNYHKNGRLLHCEWYESVLFDKNGQLLSIWSLVQDITQQVEAEEKLRCLNAELEQRIESRTAQLMAANQELEAFAYAVSHDLRAPLRRIDGFIQALAQTSGLHLDEMAQHYLQRIQANSHHMSQLIDDLLNLSRISVQTLDLDSINLSKLARQIVQELQQSEPTKEVTVAIEPDLVAKCDRNLLHVALRNLLDNAWKFSSLRPFPQIELGCMTFNGEQIYFVRDNGVGFEMAQADRLFSPFQRLHPQDEFPGLGIGLATVQRIIHRHNGRIWAESAIQQGTTFYFTLS